MLEGTTVQEGFSTVTNSWANSMDRLNASLKQTNLVGAEFLDRIGKNYINTTLGLVDASNKMYETSSRTRAGIDGLLNGLTSFLGISVAIPLFVAGFGKIGSIISSVGTLFPALEAGILKLKTAMTGLGLSMATLGTAAIVAAVTQTIIGYYQSLGEQELYLADISAETSLKRAKDLQMVVEQMKINKSMQEQMNKSIEDGMKYSVGGMKDITLFKVSSKYSELKDINDGLQALKSTITTLPDMSKFNRQIEDLFKPIDKNAMDERIASLDNFRQAIIDLNNIEKPKGGFEALLNFITHGKYEAITDIIDAPKKINAATIIQNEQKKANELALVWIKADKKRQDAIISGRTESTFSNNKVIPGTKLNVYDYKEDLRKVLKLGDTTKDTEILNAALLSVRGSLIGTSNDIQKINVDKFKTMGDWLEGMNSSLKEIKSNIDSMNFNVFSEMVKKKDFSGIEELKKFSTNSGMPEYTDLIIQASNVTDKFASSSDKLKYLKENLLETFGVIKTLKNQVVGFRETIAGLTSQLTGLESGKKTPENIDAINKAKEEIQRNKDLLLSEKDITEYRRSELMFNIAQQQRKLTGVPKSSEEYKIASKKIADLETEISLTEKNIESYKKLTEYVNLEYMQRVQLTDTYDVEYMNLDKIGKSKQKQLDIDKKIYDLQAKTRIETLESGLAADKYKYKKEYQTYTTTSVGGKISTTPDAINYENEYARLNKMAIAGQLEEKSGDIEKLAMLKKILDGEINISAEHEKGYINDYNNTKKKLEIYDAQLKTYNELIALNATDEQQSKYKLVMLQSAYDLENSYDEKLKIRLDIIKTENDIIDKQLAKQLEMNDIFSKRSLMDLELNNLFIPEDLQFKIKFTMDKANIQSEIDKIKAQMDNFRLKLSPENIQKTADEIATQINELNTKLQSTKSDTKENKEILKTLEAYRQELGIVEDLMAGNISLADFQKDSVNYQKMVNDLKARGIDLTKIQLGYNTSEYDLQVKKMGLLERQNNLRFGNAKYNIEKNNIYGDVKETPILLAQVELSKATEAHTKDLDKQVAYEDMILTKSGLKNKNAKEYKDLLLQDSVYQDLLVTSGESQLEVKNKALEKERAEIALLKEKIGLALDAIDKLSTGVTIKFDASASIKNMETSINKILTGTKLEGQDYASLTMGAIGVIDNITKQGYEAQGKNLDRELNNINLRKQLAVTEQQKNEYERQTVEIEKKKIDLELAKNTGFMGVTGAGGSALGGAVSGASTGMAFGIGGAVIGGLLGGLSGLLGGQSAEEQATYAKKQLEEQYQMTLLLQNISKYNDSMSKSLIKLSESSKAFTPEQASNKFLSTQEIKYTNVATKSQVSLGKFKTKENVEAEVKKQISDIDALIKKLTPDHMVGSLIIINQDAIDKITSAQNAVLALNGILSVTKAITENAKYINLGFEIKYYDDKGNEIPDISKYTPDMGLITAIPDFDKKEIELRMGVFSDVAYDIGKESGNLAWNGFRESFMKERLPEDATKIIGDKLKVVAEATTPDAKINALKDLQDYTDGITIITTEANKEIDQWVIKAMSSGVKMSDEYLVKFTTFGKKVVDLKTKMIDPLLANSASGLANAIKDSMKSDLTTKMSDVFSPQVMSKLSSAGIDYVDILSKGKTIGRDVLVSLGFSQTKIDEINVLQAKWNELTDKTVANIFDIGKSLTEIASLKFDVIGNFMIFDKPINSLGTFLDMAKKYNDTVKQSGTGTYINDFANLETQINKDGKALSDFNAQHQKYNPVTNQMEWKDTLGMTAKEAEATSKTMEDHYNTEIDLQKEILRVKREIANTTIEQAKTEWDIVSAAMKLNGMSDRQIAVAKAKADASKLAIVNATIPKYTLSGQEQGRKAELEAKNPLTLTIDEIAELDKLQLKQGKYNDLKKEQQATQIEINRATYTNLTLLDETKAREEDRISMLDEFINGQNTIAELKDNENASIALKLTMETRVLALMDAQIASGGKLSAIYEKLPESTKAMMENMKTINVLEYDSKNIANSMWNTQVKSIREVLKGKIIDVVFATELKDIAYTVAKISNWQIDQAEYKQQIDLITIKYWKDFYAIIASGKFTDDAGKSTLQTLSDATDAAIKLNKDLRGVSLEDLAGTLDTQITGLGDKIANNPLLNKIDTLFGDRTVSTLEQLKSETDKWNESLHQTSLLFIKIPDYIQAIMNISNDDFMKNLFQFDMTDAEKSADDLKRQLELLSNAELTIQSPFVIDWSDNITDLIKNTLNARAELEKLASKGDLKVNGTVSFASEADKEAYIKAKEAYDWSEKMIESAYTLKKTAEDTAKSFTSDLWLSEYEKVIEAMYNMSLVGKNQVETLNMQIDRNAILLGQKDAEVLKARKLADIEKELATYSGRVLDENGQLAFATEAEQKTYEKLKTEYSNVISLTVEQINLEADKLKLIQEQVNVYSIIDKEQSDLNTETKLYIASMMDSRVVHKEITDMLGIQNALISNRSTLEYKSLSFMSQWINSGGKVSEILDSMTELGKATYNGLKEALNATNYMDGLTKLGSTFGNMLKDNLVTKLFDSSFATKMVELQAKLQSAMSGTFSVNATQGVANEIMKFNISAENQRNKIQALTDILDFQSNATYQNQSNTVKYESGSTSTNNYNTYATYSISGVMVSDRSSMNWLAAEITDKVTQIQKTQR